MSNLLNDHKSKQNIKIAYIHAMTFPSREANAFDAVWTAAALSEKVDTTFFMSMLKISKSQLKQYYGIIESSLRLQSMYLYYLPDRLKNRFRNCYGSFLSIFLRFHPSWEGFRGRKILYVREPNELLFWGQQKKRQKWLKDWTLCYEAHDPLGLNPNQFKRTNPFELQDGPEGRHRQAVLQAALNFDIVICNTQILADDLKSWTDNAIQPHFITLASELPRLSYPPRIRFGDKIVIGYIGTIDQYRGVHTLLAAVRLLPQNYKLRIVGRFRKEAGVDPNWLDKILGDTQISDRVELIIENPIRDIAGEIDRCDIVLQPASSDILASRYAAPLKSFAYMVRGKPIVAADVRCHRDLFRDGESAVFYSLDPSSLADRITNLVNNPEEAERISRGAWEQAVDYSFSRRADEILSLVKGVDM